MSLKWLGEAITVQEEAGGDRSGARGARRSLIKGEKRCCTHEMLWSNDALVTIYSIAWAVDGDTYSTLVVNMF